MEHILCNEIPEISDRLQNDKRKHGYYTKLNIPNLGEKAKEYKWNYGNIL
jgi:hypothetical protein